MHRNALSPVCPSVIPLTVASAQLRVLGQLLVTSCHHSVQDALNLLVYSQPTAAFLIVKSIDLCTQ